MNLNAETGYIRSLTSLRGVAAWWVVLYHFREALDISPGNYLFKILDSGFLAVDLFFVLSGFVIFVNYHKIFERISTESVFIFLGKRLARIYPIYLLITILFLINPLAITFFSNAGEPGGRYTLSYFIATVFMVQNWGFFENLQWNIPAWSISTEFAAYLLFPILSVLLQRYFKTVWAHIIANFGLCLIIGLIFLRSGLSSVGEGIPEFGLIRCLIEFSMGVITANLFLNFKSKINRFAQWPLIFTLIIATISIAVKMPDFFFVPAICVLLVLYFSGDKIIFSSIFESQILLYVGEISYSTYLVHYLVRDWVKFVSISVGPTQFIAYIVLVFAASVILYRYVEMPGRRWIRTMISGN